MMYLQLIVAWFLADLLSGLIHYVMDKKLVIGGGAFPNVAEDNEVHHAYPTHLTTLSHWENLNTSFASPFLGWVAFALGAPMFIYMAFFFLFWANLVHRWAHSPRHKVPGAARAMQAVGLFQTAQHHSGHHRKHGVLLGRSEAQRRYCVMTNYMNPLVDWLRGIE